MSTTPPINPREGKGVKSYQFVPEERGRTVLRAGSTGPAAWPVPRAGRTPHQPHRHDRTHLRRGPRCMCCNSRYMNMRYHAIARACVYQSSRILSRVSAA
eukprot:6379907-Prymnesium_polylepis.1